MQAHQTQNRLKLKPSISKQAKRHKEKDTRNERITQVGIRKIQKWGNRTEERIRNKKKKIISNIKSDMKTRTNKAIDNILKEKDEIKILNKIEMNG